MRLIDADEILLNEESEYTKTIWEVDYTVKIIIKAVHNNIQTLIQEAPTIDAVPVRHGKWVIENYNDKLCIPCCSECNVFVTLSPYKLNYCPNCGAKMDGGDQNA